MSILIKGLGMPNAHQVRPFYLKGNGDGTATVYEYTTGMKTGVAVPLPEKHGRLGDLDALEVKFREEALEHTLIGDLNRMTLGVGEVIDRIRMADTIVPAD